MHINVLCPLVLVTRGSGRCRGGAQGSSSEKLFPRKVTSWCSHRRWHIPTGCPPRLGRLSWARLCPPGLTPSQVGWWRWLGRFPEARLSLPAGNSSLVYAIIRKRSVFHQLASLPADPPAIQKALQRRRRAPEPLSRSGSQEGTSMEGSRPAAPAEPGTLKTSLVATPGLAGLAWGGACGSWRGWGMGGVSGKAHGLSRETEEMGWGGDGGGGIRGPRREASRASGSTGHRGGGHCISEVGGGKWKLQEPWAGDLTPTWAPLGIDKLTEKSQVSEDGTLRSLEPASQQSSADGCPAEEVRDRGSWSGVKPGVPFLPSICGIDLARALWGHLQQRGRHPADSLGRRL